MKSFRHWLEVLLLAAAYFGLGKFGLMTAVPQGVATPCWPPSGIALAAVLILGRRVWPGIWLGSFLVNIGIFFDGSSLESVARAVLESSFVAAGSTGQALLGGWLILRGGERNPLARVQDVFRFAAQAGVLGCTVSATVGVTSVCVTGFAPWSAWPINWVIWWLGDSLGVLIVTPTLLAWTLGGPVERRQRWLELVLCLALAFWFGLLVFFSTPASTLSARPLVLVFIPFVAWAAVRFGQQETMLMLLLVTGLSVFGTARGVGPFASNSSHENLLSLEVFLAVTTLTALGMAATVNERRNLESAWRRVTHDLESRVADRTAELMQANELLTKTARRLETLVAFSKAIASTRDVDTLLDHVVGRLMEVVTASEVGVVCMFDVATQTLVPRAYRGFDIQWLGLVRLRPGEGVAGRAFQTGKSMLVGSADEYVEMWREISPEPREHLRRALNHQLLRGVIVAPVRSPSGEVLGTIGLGSGNSVFEREDLELLEGVAGLAGAAIENVRLLQQAQDAERRFRAIFENAVEGFFQSTPEGRFLQVNPAVARMFGYDSPQQMIAEITDVERQLYVDPERRAVFQRLLGEHGEVRGFEIQDRTRDGRIIWVSEHARAVRDVAGRLLYYEGTVQDITQRKQAEERLAASELRFRSLLQNSADATLVLDEKATILFDASQMGSVLGYVNEDNVGRSAFEFVHPDDQPEIVRMFERVRNDPSGRVSTEFRGLHKSGEWRWLACVGTNHFATPGVEGIVVNLHDVTEKHRNEEELHRLLRQIAHERARLESVLRQMPAGVVIVEAPSGRLLLANELASKITRMPLRTNVGFDKYPRDRAFHLDGRQYDPDLLPLRRSARLGQVFENEELEYLCGDNVRRILSINSGPIRDATGSIVAAVVTFHDVTERTRAEAERRDNSERLQALSRRLIEVQEAERRHLARELHDEIGQVLTALAINLNAALSSTDSAAHPYLEESLRIVDRAIHQVRNLSLDLRPSMLDDFGLEAALRWYLDRLGQRAGLNIQFVCDLGGERFPAGLETACFRVAQEALTNVARHAKARHVTLELHKNLADLVLGVYDDGVGFDVPRVRDRSAEGQNFGLLGMRERVDLIGGRMEIESRPGDGTKVRLWVSTLASAEHSLARSEHEGHSTVAGR